MHLPEDKTVNIHTLGQILDPKYLTNSYKLFWFLAIFEEVRTNHSLIDFRKLVLRMIAKAWYPSIKYKLNFGVQDQLQNIIQYVFNKFNIDIDLPEEKLVDLLDSLSDVEFDKKVAFLCNWVPYRLISPFFPELTGIKDSLKNKRIVELSQVNHNCLYEILPKEKQIIISQYWFEYLRANQIIINGWLNYKLVNFLQHRNPNVPGISFKLGAPQKRDLTIAKNYWRIVMNNIDVVDIYTGTILTSRSTSNYNNDIISIDHFIPWSFVLHDQLWNLVPTIRSVNSSKNDKLPLLSLYLERFSSLQYAAFNVIRSRMDKRYLEDYITIDHSLFDTSQNISEDYFIRKLQNTIKPLYQIAYNQGFTEWHN